MNRYWICLAAWVLTASACANAQDATVVRVRSGLVPPLDVAVPADRGSATPFNVPPPTEIGERTLGPLRLRGFAHDQEGVGRIEQWEYVHPTTRTATDPFVYPPIGIELTVSMSTGERLETRATSVRRVPLEADTFVVPDPAP